jgi:hypothetical protein
MENGNAKQQIVDKIKEKSNILVTVSKDPSVDELSAALGLTLLLNKMKKHATAVFSGAIPPAITFLDPEKTFENTVDSLRDFIIALDKEKADHLRYKVDGDVVKIFITPYRTTITNDDLEFSQGDYNVELVLALGVQNRDELDGALAAHGRILHDATVVSVMAGGEESDLGSINWREEKASSLSEMLVGLVDGLKSDKPLLDEQIATAFLTGLVAATDRFSNDQTSSRVMTMAAQLMTAGANQQLIASKLEAAHEIGPDAEKTPPATESENADGTTDMAEGESTKLTRNSKKSTKPTKKADDGSLTISHEKTGDVDEVAQTTEAEGQTAAAKKAEEELAKQAQEVPAAQQETAAKKAEQDLAKQLASVAPAATAATPSVADLQKDLAAANADMSEAATQEPGEAAPVEMTPELSEQEPAMGGTLNATTEQAAEDKRRALKDDRNKTILTHGGGKYITDSQPAFQSPLNAAAQPAVEPPNVDPFKEATLPSITGVRASGDHAPQAPAPSFESPAPQPLPAPAHREQPPVAPEPAPAPPVETLADLDRQNRAPAADHEEARAAVNAAFSAVPFSPAGNPAENIGAQSFGDISHEEQPASMATPAPEAPLLPPPPPMPDFSSLPPLPPQQAPESAPMGALPPEKLEDVLGGAPAPVAAQPQSNDPAQFRIPGQG